MPSSGSLLDHLTGGDRRSIGRANEVVTAVLANPALLSELVPGLAHDDPLIRMRAADALAKVGEQRPEFCNHTRPRSWERGRARSRRCAGTSRKCWRGWISPPASATQRQLRW